MAKDRLTLKLREEEVWAKYRSKNNLPPKAEELTPEQARQREMLFREIARRRMQALKLYKPLPKQEAFHRSKAPERLALGGNRGAKTMCCAVELAWAATGTHPFYEYPKENIRIICVAKDGTKIGQVFYDKLFKAGAFKMCIDKRTGLWRAYQPWKDPPDMKTKPALPLIPQTAIKSVAWEDKKLNHPKLVSLHNGGQILFCTSAGKPVEGIDVDLVWFDEEVYEGPAGSSWYAEMAARLVDRSGRFMWSATPQGATTQLWKLYERALAESADEQPAIELFHMTMDDNPYLPEKAKESLKKKLAEDPDEYRVRVQGQFLVTSHLVFPSFSKAAHCCAPFQIPDNWTRYLALDPGFSNIFAILLAVPPAGEKHDQIFVYDELYLHQVDAMQFANELRHKMSGQVFEAFIIDRHGSIRTTAFGKNDGQAFEEAFEHHNIRSIATGTTFIRRGGGGTAKGDVIRGQLQQVRKWLGSRAEQGGTPKLQIFDTCTALIKQMSHYRHKLDKFGKPTDFPESRYDSHGCDALRYAVLQGVPYVARTVRHQATSAIYKYLQTKLKRNRKDQYVLLGAGD